MNHAPLFLFVLLSVCVSVAPAAAADPLAAFGSGTLSVIVTEEEREDSHQWHVRGQALYERTKDLQGAYDALSRAIELDPANGAAFALLQVVARKLARPLPREADADAELPDAHVPQSPSARRWFGSGMDALRDGAFERALYCFEYARRYEPDDPVLFRMVARARREAASADLKTRYGPSGTPPPPKKDDPERAGTKIFNLALADRIVQGERPPWNPGRAAEWIGVARYLLKVKSDPFNAARALAAARAYDDRSPLVLETTRDIDAAVKARREREESEAKAAEEKRKAEKEKAEREALARRTVVVTEVEPRSATPVATGPFADLPFLDETAEAAVAEPSAAPEGPEVLETTLDLPTPGAKARRREETREAIRKRLRDSEERFREGKGVAALLDYEKAYEKALDVTPEDPVALYQIVLISQKLGERRAALERFLELVPAVEKAWVRYSDQPRVVRVRQAVECHIKGALIRGAVGAYNRVHEHAMTRESFSLPKLVRERFLPYNEATKVLTLSLALGRSGTPDPPISLRIETLGCPARGGYRLGDDGEIGCSIHGLNVLVGVRSETDRRPR